MTLIADVFPILETPKNVVRSMSKKCRFRESFEKEHEKSIQICWNLNDITFTIFIDQCAVN